MLDLQTILIFLVVFAAGALLAAAFFVISYMADRKALADDRKENGYSGPKR